jgi:hypothetical protein
MLFELGPKCWCHNILSVVKPIFSENLCFEGTEDDEISKDITDRIYKMWRISQRS